jgi:hypothetical protein
MSWLSLATTWISDKNITDPSFLPILHALGKMLTSTVVSLKPFSYPTGDTPAADLLRNLRPGKEPVEVLALGCGDVRNILFTLWSQQHSTCKLNFTTCDSDPAVLGKRTSFFPCRGVITLLRGSFHLATAQICGLSQIVTIH